MQAIGLDSIEDVEGEIAAEEVLLTRAQKRDPLGGEVHRERIARLREVSALYKEAQSRAGVVTTVMKQLPSKTTNIDPGMPSCSERTLMLALSKADGEGRFTPKWAEELKDQLQKQGLMGNSGVADAIDAISKGVHASDERSVSKYCVALLTLIQPLNIYELGILVAKARAASAIVKGEKIVLTVGETGCGKSTTTLFLAGCRMDYTPIPTDEGNLFHISAVEYPNESLRAVVSSPYSESETRYITPVTISLQDLKGAKKLKGKLVVCDAPGLGDTAGAEIDIANGVGMVEALNCCKSVVILTFGSFKSLGDRGQGLQKIAHWLCKTIRGIHERLSNVHYVFTKFPKDVDIVATLGELNTMVEGDTELSRDEDLSTVLSDMLEKARRFPVRVDPVNGDPTIIAERLSRCTGVQFPQDAFQFSVSDSSIWAVSSQIKWLNNGVSSAVKVGNYQLAKYYNDSALKLKSYVELPGVVDCCNECWQAILQHLKECEDQCVRSLGPALSGNVEAQGEFRKTMEMLLRAGSVGFPVLNLMEKLTSSLQPLINEQLVRVLWDRQHPICLSALQEMDTHQGFQSTYAQYVSKLSERFANLGQQAVVEFRNWSFLPASETLGQLQDAVQKLKGHVDRIEEEYTSVTSQCISYLKKYRDEHHKYLATNCLSEGEVMVIRECLDRLKSATSTPRLSERLSYGCDSTVPAPEETVCQMYSSFIKRVVEYFGSAAQNLLDSLQKPGYGVHVDRWVRDMDAIRTLEDVKSATDYLYSNTIHRVRWHVADSLSDECGDDLDKLDYARMAKRLSNLKWMRDRPGWDNPLQSFTDALCAHAEESFERLCGIDFSLEHPEGLSDAVTIAEKIGSMRVLAQFDPEIGRICKKTAWHFQGEVHSAIRKLHLAFNLQDLLEDDFAVRMRCPRDIVKFGDAEGDPDQLSGLLTALDRLSINTRMGYLTKESLAIMEVSQVTCAESVADIPASDRDTEEEYCDTSMTLPGPDPLGSDTEEERGELVQADDCTPVELDCVLAEKGLLYLSLCKNIRAVSEQAYRTHELLESLVLRFGCDLERRIGFDFEVSLMATDEAKRRRASQSLSELLHAFSLLQKHTRVFEAISGGAKLEQWKKTFVSTLNSLTTELASELSPHLIHSKLNTLLALSCLDAFCGSLIPPSGGFTVLYHTCHRELKQAWRNECSDISTSIQTRNYPRVAHGLVKLVDYPDGRAALAQFREELSKSLDSLIDETTTKATWINDWSSVPLEQIAGITSNMRLIRSASTERALMDLIGEDSHRIMEGETAICAIISQRFESGLGRVQCLLGAKKYLEADVLMGTMAKVRLFLGPLCGGEGVVEKLREVSSMFDKAVQELKEGVYACREDIKMRPPSELLEILKAASQSSKFMGAHESAKADLHRILTTEITAVSTATGRDRSQKMREFEALILHLPLEMRELYGLHLRQIEKVTFVEREEGKLDLDGVAMKLAEYERDVECAIAKGQLNCELPHDPVDLMKRILQASEKVGISLPQYGVTATVLPASDSLSAEVQPRVGAGPSPQSGTENGFVLISARKLKCSIIMMVACLCMAVFGVAISVGLAYKRAKG